MAHKLKTLASICDDHLSLPVETLKLLQETPAIYNIISRISSLLDFQSATLYVIDNADQICAAISIGANSRIYRSEQATNTLAQIATADSWYFLPQGAVLAAFKTSADEMLHYNWHPSDILCLPFSPENIPLTAFLAVSKPRENHVSLSRLQSLQGYIQWLSSEIKQTHLAIQLSNAKALHQRAKAALAAQNRRENAPSPTTESLVLKTEALSEADKHQQIQTELTQRNRELLSLQAAIAATASSLDVPFVLETVTWEVANLLNVEGCTVSEWHKTNDAATIVAKYGLENWWEQSSSAEKDTLCPLKQQVHTEKYAAQITIGQPHLHDADRNYMQQAGIKTLLILPMIFQNEILGIVEIFDSRTERVFSDREISLTQLLANQAATTFINARLYHQAQSELKERKKAQEQITVSLHEKEILLKEIHHRVKNNLQIISSLLFLQSRNIKDDVILQALQESRARVQTMAMIHERLYQSTDLARIDFVEYLRKLANELVRNYNQSTQPTTFKFEGGNILLDINISVPCGLIVNELISNALKHAFPKDPTNFNQDREPNTIFISLMRKNGQIELIVGDNGIGIPSEMDLEHTNSLGMQLVTMLTQQIQGKLELKRSPGTTFTIVFPAQ